MKKFFAILTFLISFAVSAQEKPALQPQIVEASCGQCNFGMKGGGCTLAVRIDGKPYFVDGTTIHDHGDAHAADGFCAAIRQAEVTGEIVDGRYKAQTFRLLALTPKKN